MSRISLLFLGVLLIYRHLIETRGIDQAQHYAEANRSGVLQICDWVVEIRHREDRAAPISRASSVMARS